MSDPKHLAWIDLETTGTDEDKDLILEVGLAITDRNLDVIESGSWMVWAPTLERLFNMDPVVVEMHTKSGLIKDLLMRRGERPYISNVDAQVAKVLKEYTTDGQIHIAGSGVGHFDRRFIKKQMPQTEKLLAYAPVDIGVVRRFLKLADYPIPTDVELTHRALGDVFDHIEEAKQYLALMRTLIPEAPTCGAECGGGPGCNGAHGLCYKPFGHEGIHETATGAVWAA